MLVSCSHVMLKGKWDPDSWYYQTELYVWTKLGEPNNILHQADGGLTHQYWYYYNQKREDLMILGMVPTMERDKYGQEIYIVNEIIYTGTIERATEDQRLLYYGYLNHQDRVTR